jgi:hypothetical protein
MWGAFSATGDIKYLKRIMTLSTTNKNRYQGIINDKSSFETQSRKKDNYSVTKILQKSKTSLLYALNITFSSSNTRQLTSNTVSATNPVHLFK